MSAPLLVANGHANVIAAARVVNGIITLSAPARAYEYKANGHGLLEADTHQLDLREVQMKSVQRQRRHLRWR